MLPSELVSSQGVREAYQEQNGRRIVQELIRA